AGAFVTGGSRRRSGATKRRRAIEMDPSDDKARAAEASVPPSFEGPLGGRFADLLAEHCAVRLDPRGPRKLGQGAGLRAPRAGAAEAADYFDRLTSPRLDREELDELAVHLHASETAFFRPPLHFDALRLAFAPRATTSEAPVRLLCAGCATGEEAYSVAISL